MKEVAILLEENPQCISAHAHACSRELYLALTLNSHAQELTLEVKGHEPEVEAVSNEAYRMLQQNHFAASEIKVKLDGVIEAQKAVNDAVETRRVALEQSLAAQEYYAKNNEAQQVGVVVAAVAVVVAALWLLSLSLSLYLFLSLLRYC